MNDAQMLQQSGRDLFTQTRLRAFRKCPRFHYLRFEVGLVEAEVKKALRMGSAFHLGQEELAKLPPAYTVEERKSLEEQGRADEIEARDKERDEGMERAIHAALIDYHEPPPNGVDAEEWAVERETVGRMLMGYTWRWQNEPVEIIHAERQFKQPILNVETGQPVYKIIPSKVGPPKRVQLWRAGMIDKMIRLPDSRVAILEHKTTGDSIKADSDYWRQARMSSQVTFYFKAALDDPSLPDPDTIFYDVIRKPQIEPKLLTQQETRDFLGMAYRKGKKTIVPPDADKLHKYFDEEFEVFISGEIDNEDPDKTVIEGVAVDGASATIKDGRLRETPTMFGARLMQDMVDRPEMYFSREEIARLQGDIEEFVVDVHQTVEMILYCQRTGQWPKNTDSCVNPYRCEFYNLCSNNVQLTIDGVPPKGFAKLDHVHPELQESPR